MRLSSKRSVSFREQAVGLIISLFKLNLNLKSFDLLDFDKARESWVEFLVQSHSYIKNL